MFVAFTGQWRCSSAKLDPYLERTDKGLLDGKSSTRSSVQNSMETHQSRLKTQPSEPGLAHGIVLCRDGPGIPTALLLTEMGHGIFFMIGIGFPARFRLFSAGIRSSLSSLNTHLGKYFCVVDHLRYWATSFQHSSSGIFGRGHVGDSN